MMARFPAPMSGWSLIVPTVVDTILTALAPAIPEKIPAAHHGLLGGAVVFFGVNPKTRKRFVVQSLEGGGWGGRPFEDGESGSVTICQGDVRNGTIEGLELKNPVLIEERSLRRDSGGAGKFRGGLGIDLRVRNFVEGRWNLHRPRRIDCPPWGLWGGKPAGTADYMLKLPGESEFKSMDASQHLVPADSEVIVRTGGGGGWGDPLDRDPERVLGDVIEGIVSAEKARSEYGVVLDTRAFAVDIAGSDATSRREKIRRQVLRRQGTDLIRAPSERKISRVLCTCAHAHRFSQSCLHRSASPLHHRARARPNENSRRQSHLRSIFLRAARCRHRDRHLQKAWTRN